MAKTAGDPTRKPIPETWHEWRKECDGIKRYLVETVTAAKAKDNAWVRSQRKYYRARLAHLRKHEPRK